MSAIANIAEQHEVWDFLSPSSKNYSFEKSASVMRNLAVNVDDAMDDIARQIKGGLMRTVVGSPSTSYEPAFSVTTRNLSWNSDDINKLGLRQSTSELINGFSVNEEGDKDVNHMVEKVDSSAQASGWHSDNELDLNGIPPRVVKCNEDVQNLDFDSTGGLRVQSESHGVSRFPEASLASTSVHKEGQIEVPPEWTPPNLGIPVLNLVDKLFQLKRRVWLRRQVFWISKREDNIAQGIRWVQDALWPDGTFFGS
ncbi:Crooked neck-like protein 1 [Olea europaea subsp. europaea]|uniref:Crooked neck-like protein 1 n=1 Tax=Olea europaea subsp. europaea TaxID=158383 RepID=A0A8S0VER5_OLEEU|nr:Crooked neck-like protein 1 [Olea europaea subsp. europaea]